MKIVVFVLISLFVTLLSISSISALTAENSTTVNLENSLPPNEISLYEEGEEKEMFSEKDICGLMKGCYNSEFEIEIDLQGKNNTPIDTDLYMDCLPYGYRINNKYCGFKEVTSKYTKKTRFKLDLFEQLNSSEKCLNSFECKSNFCFNGECVDTIKTVDDEIVRINKSDLEELRNIIENVEDSLEENYNEEVSRSFFSTLLGWFRTILT